MRIKSRFLLTLSLVLFTRLTVSAGCSAVQTDSTYNEIRETLSVFKSMLIKSDPRAEEYYKLIYEYLDNNSISDSILLSDCYYYLGTYKYLDLKLSEAISLLGESVSLRRSLDTIDDIYAKAQANLGLSYMYTGKNEDARKHLQSSLDVKKELFGSRSPLLAQTYLNLSAVYIEMGMLDKALDMSLRGIKLEEDSPGTVQLSRLISLYHNSSASYLQLMDYNSAKRNAEIALAKSGDGNQIKESLLFKFYNILARVNDELDNTNEASAYYSKAINILESENFLDLFVLAVYENYAFFLADNEIDNEKAFTLLEKAVRGAEKVFGKNSRNHVIYKITLAYFLTDYLEEFDRAEVLLGDARSYIERNPHDRRVFSEINLYYSKLMLKKGNLDRAFKNINMNLDDPEGIRPRTMIESYITSVKVLLKLYGRDNDLDALRGSHETSEELLKLIEESRLKITGDESRNKLSGKYNEAYDLALSSAWMLFRESGERKYLEECLEVSEKAKAAGLLMETRSNRAIDYHLPPELSRLEKDLLADIRDYGEAIYKENEKENPDDDLVAYYQEQVFSASARHDSLVDVFEEDYPRYFNLKHNSNVSSIDEIKKAVGRKGNFIEYYLSDSLLYIFLVNRDGIFAEEVLAGDELKEKIIKYRSILLNPSINSGAIKQYREFTRLSGELYNILLQPLTGKLVSNKLIISADDIIAYIPFETLIDKKPGYDNVNYRDLSYLMKEYEIIYEYSATLMTETTSSTRRIRNDVLCFAPDYSRMVDIEELMLSRQVFRDSLANIPGAKKEAVYINKLLGGKLFVDESATESAFKKNAADGDIVHLAMHTLLNDRDPMYSKMVFSIDADTLEDGMLNTYEVYNTPVNASLVFLSSCNTGSGYLQAGEGVMSLARGFFYSGSPSVVMSLWEVDDESGNEIVKGFYNNLKKGYSKSRSLKAARKEYLENADQVRSHPYFWSTLVIMGRDNPVYFPPLRIVYLLLGLGLLFFITRYLYRSRLS